MKTITLRTVELDRDLGQLAELFTAEQNEPTTEAGLRSDYEAHKEQIMLKIKGSKMEALKIIQPLDSVIESLRQVTDEFEE